jgi:MarR family transcriptional regulator, organic hydroperoxide resistance regulator
MKAGLGTQLRHLIELLDGAVEAGYREQGLDYRPRYTPVMRALSDQRVCTINQIAERAGITQPSATQTVALMLKLGLLEPAPGATDARTRPVQLSAHGRRLLPTLETAWQATTLAAQSLDAELPYPLSVLLEQAIQALNRRPFGARISAARKALKRKASTP